MAAKHKKQNLKFRLADLGWLLCIIVGIGMGALLYRTPPTQSEGIAGIDLGGAFTLVDQNNHKVTEKSWPGKYLLVYFGFTHCPDMCPTGLSKIADIMKSLPKAQADKIQPLFITVDPARDKAKDLKTYIAAFHSNIIGLTGSDKQIEQVEKLYRVYAEKQGDGPDYMVNHSGFMYLMDPSGENIAIFAHDMSNDDMTQTLRGDVK
jgi:protein SCO1/2